jgi:hypothetical protein
LRFADVLLKETIDESYQHRLARLKYNIELLLTTLPFIEYDDQSLSLEMINEYLDEYVNTIQGF